MKKSILLSALGLAALALACGEEDKEQYYYITNEYIDTAYYKHIPHIDLGLTVYWAETNIGADTTTASGDFFAWREMESKASYDSTNYDGTANNPVAVSWGGVWRMPTHKEMLDLMNKCDWEWIDSVSCYKVTGSTGKSILLPLSGHMEADSVISSDYFGEYWTSDLLPINGAQAYSLFLATTTDTTFRDMRHSARWKGLQIRPVADIVKKSW